MIRGVKQKPKHLGTDSQLRSLTSLNQVEYDELLSVFDLVVQKKLAHYTLNGKFRKKPVYVEYKNSSLSGSQRKLDFMLMYLKENPNQAYHGYCFGLSQSKVSEWVSFLSPVLEASLKRLGCMPQLGDCFSQEAIETDYLLMDVTERLVPRRTDPAAHKQEYSGKKKRYTIKNLAITDHKGYVLFLSHTYEGTVHDKAIWDQLQITEYEQNILGDLGFLGAEKNQQNLILPFRKPRKSKTHSPKLRPTQKQINQTISSLRVRIEHAFASIKRLKIIRLKSFDKRDQIMRIATAIHNLRMIFRKPVSIHS